MIEISELCSCRGCSCHDVAQRAVVDRAPPATGRWPCVEVAWLPEIPSGHARHAAAHQPAGDPVLGDHFGDERADAAVGVMRLDREARAGSWPAAAARSCERRRVDAGRRPSRSPRSPCLAQAARRRRAASMAMLPIAISSRSRPSRDRLRFARARSARRAPARPSGRPCPADSRSGPGDPRSPAGRRAPAGDRRGR